MIVKVCQIMCYERGRITSLSNRVVIWRSNGAPTTSHCACHNTSTGPPGKPTFLERACVHISSIAQSSHTGGSASFDDKNTPWKVGTTKDKVAMRQTVHVSIKLEAAEQMWTCSGNGRGGITHSQQYMAVDRFNKQGQEIHRFRVWSPSFGQKHWRNHQEENDPRQFIGYVTRSSGEVEHRAGHSTFHKLRHRDE